MFFAVRLPVIAAACALVACSTGPAPVTPAEIPELEARVAQEPQNGAVVLRYAAALFSANRCDTAVATARNGMRLAPANAIGPLVVGQCQERAGNAAQAIATYRAFMQSHPEVRGIAAVEAREMLAVRAHSTQQARAALQREAQLTAENADPQAVAVLPLHIAGDSSYQPLSRGLAQMLTSDLALLQRFRMVERLQLGAIFDELRFQQGARVDVSTAARVGRLIQAGRLVQGAAAIPSERDVRLEASVVLASGEVTGPEVATGRLRDLLRMEKDLVVGLASRLGYQLSVAERQAILENGTQNLTAFLAYSNGLLEEDLGNYAAAAAFYGQAVQADPRFQAARTQYRAARAAPAAQQASAGQVTTVAGQTVQPPSDPLRDAIGSTVGDIAPTQAEQVASVAQTHQGAVNTPINQQPPGSTSQPLGIIRIVFVLP